MAAGAAQMNTEGLADWQALSFTFSIVLLPLHESYHCCRTDILSVFLLSAFCALPYSAVPIPDRKNKDCIHTEAAAGVSDVECRLGGKSGRHPFPLHENRPISFSRSFPLKEIPAAPHLPGDSLLPTKQNYRLIGHLLQRCCGQIPEQQDAAGSPAPSRQFGAGFRSLNAYPSKSAEDHRDRDTRQRPARLLLLLPISLVRDRRRHTAPPYPDLPCLPASETGQFRKGASQVVELLAGRRQIAAAQESACLE